MDATFCRHCGSSEADGWRDESMDESDDFDYEEFIEENFSATTANTNTRPIWRLVAVVILAIFVITCLLPLL